MAGQHSLLLSLLTAIIFCSTTTNKVEASDKETDRLIHDAMLPQPSQLEQVNQFVSHSKVVGKKPDKTVQVNNGLIFAKLTTPLNSSFNRSGDDVRAVVVSSENQHGKPWLEEGAILEGCVESSQKAAYGQTDGSLVIRFYKAKIGEKEVELYSSSDTEDGSIKPTEHKAPTKKQKVRGVLMTVSRLAIPAAMGTGGMSLAISAGAGAAIGLAFSDKGKRIQGTVRGAYEGAGLSFLDPLVCKGQQVVLAEGTPIQLQLNEPVVVPPYVPNPNKVSTSEDTSANLIGPGKSAATVTNLQTHAELLNSGKASVVEDVVTRDDPSHLSLVNRKIAQNDLAGAMSELETAEALYPDDQNLKSMHEEILNLVTGKQTAAQTR